MVGFEVFFPKSSRSLPEFVSFSESERPTSRISNRVGFEELQSGNVEEIPRTGMEVGFDSWALVDLFIYSGSYWTSSWRVKAMIVGVLQLLVMPNIHQPPIEIFLCQLCHSALALYGRLYEDIPLNGSLKRLPRSVTIRTWQWSLSAIRLTPNTLFLLELSGVI